MKHHGSVLSGQRRVAFELLSFPVIRLEVETPKSSNICVSVVILASKEIHHIVVNDSRVRVNIAE